MSRDTVPAAAPAGLVVEEPGTHCLFDNRWWLEAVHPGELQVIELPGDGGLRARMPLPLSRRWGVVSARQPALTQTLGPWVRTVSDNPARQHGFEKDAMAELIARMPRIDFHSLNLHPSRGNWLPFFWAGFHLAPRLTYRLDDLRDPERLWSQVDGSVRTDVRKARRAVACEATDDIDAFLAIYRKTFARQGLVPPQDDAVVRRLDAACARRGCRRILLARDDRGQVHAGAYLVWDSRCAYYLMAGGDPALRGSGAATLLMWEAISFAAGVTRSFDFEGSMGEAIERFFRAFGGRQATFLNARRASRPVRAAFVARDAFALLRGR